jgi:serine/threonine protein kinase
MKFDSTTVTAGPAELPLLSPGLLLAGGRYRIERFLGRGGMGAVFRAADLVLIRPVAIKAMLPAADAKARERFLQEAQVAAQMDHPHLVRVFDFLQGPTDLLVMEFVDGSTVRHLLSEATRESKSAGLDLRMALRITRDVLDGLAALHSRGIVHRDIKPANFLLRRHDAQVKLSDFGLAVPLDHSPPACAGTPGYLAPEVERFEPATPASDVFGIGVSLYELLTDVKPRAGKPVQEIRDRLSGLGGPSAGALAEFVARCLAEHAADRYPTAAEALKALERLPAGDASSDRLLHNRIALVLRDGDLADFLATALSARGLLSPVLVVDRLDHPGLAAGLGALDAIILDLESDEPERIEQFIDGVRRVCPNVVFFLALAEARRTEVLSRFSPPWRKRLDHYFSLPLDHPLSELPAVVRQVARQILFDQRAGRSVEK